MPFFRLAIVCALAATPSFALSAAEAEPPAAPAAPVEKPAPYDGKLQRFAEILGSVHYLRNLCAAHDPSWRQAMAALLEDETKGEPKRAAQLTAAFNRGYRSFAATYARCTPQAVEAESRYRAEGATLAAEITARFGN